jgi:hypothetical protein
MDGTHWDKIKVVVRVGKKGGVKSLGQGMTVVYTSHHV